MTPEVEAALSAPHFIQVTALKIELPTVTARFFLGRGQLEIGGETYHGTGIAGEDSIFGQIDAIEGRTEDEAPRVRIQIAGLASTVASEVREYEAQGSPVTIIVAVLNRTTHAVIADPEDVFYGFLDAVEPEVGETSIITCEAASAMEWLFREDGFSRWNDRAHQSVWPDEKGFEFVADTRLPLAWGDTSAVLPGSYVRPGRG